MYVAVDKPKVLELKNQSKALSFTVVFMDEKEGPLQIIPFFRLMDGVISFPKVRRGASWLPVGYFGPFLAKLLYQAVEKTGWVTEFELPALAPLSVAIEELVGTKIQQWKSAPKYAVV